MKLNKHNKDNTMKKSEIQQIIKEELKNVLKEADYRGIHSDINETWENNKIIENDIYKFLEHSYESGGPELVKDVMNAINNAMNKARQFLREGKVDIHDQGYGASYHNITSDILEKWNDTKVINQDVKGYIAAAHEAGGPKLAKEVMKTVVGAVEQSKPLLQKWQGTDYGTDLA